MFSIKQWMMAVTAGVAFTSTALAGNAPTASTDLFDRAADMVKGRQAMSAVEIASSLGSGSQGSSQGTQITFPAGIYMGVSVSQIRVATTQAAFPSLWRSLPTHRTALMPRRFRRAIPRTACMTFPLHPRTTCTDT